MSAGDTEGNYNYSDIGTDHCQPFTGYPDKLRFWASFYATSGSVQARVSAIIHDNYAMHDPINNNSHAVCIAEKEFVRTTSSSSNASSTWQQYEADFNYSAYATYNATAQYILVTFTTNKTPGQGNKNDRLYMDDIEMVYIGEMTDIKLNGTTIPNFNQNTYEYTVSCCADNIPTVTATALSTIANSKGLVHITDPTPSNNYTATINRLGSNITYTIHFNLTSPTITLSNNGNYTVCAGQNVTMTASGADSYSWSNGLGNNATATYSNTASGEYTVTVTGTTNGCSSSANAYITVNPIPNVTINGSANATASVCSGTPTSLSAGGATSYAWSNGSTSNAINVSNAGTYTVTGTSNNCSTTATATVAVYDNPTVSISGPNYICSGTTSTLTASGATSYTWGGTGSGSDNPLTITAGGTYTVTGIDDHGCSGTASLQVTSKNAPTVTINGPDQLCAGSTATLTATSAQPGTTFSWPNGTQTITEAGTYSVTANLDGCSTTTEKTVSSAESPVAPTAAGDARCGSGTVTLAVTNPDENLTYNWYSNGASSASATGVSYTPYVSQTTVYQVSAMNAAGCVSDRVSVTATVNATPAAPSVSSTSVCGEGDITLNSNYHWYSDVDGNNEILNTNQHITNTTTFYAAVIENGCRSTLSPMTVSVKQVPAAPTANDPDPICSNGSTNVTLQATSTGNTIYWYNSEMDSLGRGNSYQVKNISASATFFAKAVSADGCESALTAVHVVINPLPNAPIVSDTSVCGEQEIDLLSQGSTITWYSDANGNNVIETNPTISTTTTFYAAVIDNNGCRSAIVPKTITVNNNYTNITDEKSACGSYTWAGHTYTESGSYIETLQSSKGCDSTVTLILTINNGFNEVYDTVACDQFEWAGQTYTNTGSDTKHFVSTTGCDSTVTYNFTIKHSSSSNQTLTLCSDETPYNFLGTSISSSGSYTIRTTNTEGCDSVITLQVTVNPAPSMPTISDKSFCGAGNYTLTATLGQNGTVCRWYDMAAGGEPIATSNSYNSTFDESTTLYVTSYNANSGCESDRKQVNVTVNAVPAIASVSNAPRCGAGTIYLSATPDENGTECRWFINPTTSTTIEPVEENTIALNYNGNQSYTMTRYVEAFNATTGCKSARQAVTATWNALPAAPQVTSNVVNCGTLNADLADYVTGATLYRWYDADEMLLDENAHYVTTVEESTSFKVSNYNSETGCESAKQILNITIHPNYAPQSLYDTVCQGVVYENYDLNVSFSETGTQEIVLHEQSSASCDSLVTLYLYVKPVVTNSIADENCEVYDWNGTIYDHSGEYTQTFTAANGCDSIVTLTLTIHPATTYEWETATCDEYTWNDSTYTASGDYIQRFETANGCDSVVTLHLTVREQNNSEIFAEVCRGESYMENGFEIADATVSSDFSHTNPDVNGCDSTTVLHLTVHQPATTVINETLCLGESYNENGFVFTATEVGQFSLDQHQQTIHGCDSAITLNITVHPTSAVTLTDATCENSRYNENGFDTTFVESGVYTLIRHDQNVYNCDSVTTIELTVNPIFETDVYDTICFNGAFDFHGTTLNETGDYQVTLSSVNQCDSLINLHLYVRPEKRREINADICLDGDYHQYDFNIDHAIETHDYEHSTLDVNGCDSTTVLHLIVHEPKTTNLEATLCKGASYNQYGFVFTANWIGDSTFTQVYSTTFHCDSTVNLHVTVNPTHHVILYDTICAAERYSENGFDTIFAQPGTQTLYNDGTNIFGCDSLTELRLTVTPIYNVNISRMICESGSYTFNGEVLTEAGTYPALFQSVNGCDSLVTLTLTVGIESRDTIEAHVCYGSDYNQNGFNITNITEESYEELQSIDGNGCPSTTVLHLIVHELNTTDLYATLCLGEVYRNNGFNVTGSKVGDTTYTRIIPTFYGCDSTLVLHVTVNPTSAVTLADEICAGNRYQENHFDTLFTEAGVYTLVNHDQNIFQCDSVTTLTLTVWPNQSSEIDTTICYNGSYNFHGTIITEAGTYVDTLPTVHGCDSVVTLHLDIYPENTFEFTETACVSYTWNDSIYTASNDYVQHFTDLNGCDSTVTLHLTVLPASVGDTTAFACDRFDWYNHTNITESGEFTHTFTNAVGCDSVVTLHLTVGHSNTGDTTAVACYSFDWYEHTGITASCDTLTHTFVNASGCDSVVTLHLTIHYAETSVIDTTVCDSFTWNDSVYTVSNDYIQHFTNRNGCDSTVTLHLTVNYAETFAFDTTVCDSFTWNDSVYTVSNDYIQHFTNRNGCDSTVTLHLTVNHTETSAFDTVVCDSFTWNDAVYTTSGDYPQVFTNRNGCDSTVTVHLTVNHAQFNQFSATTCDSYTWNDSTYTTTGEYDQVFTDINGCDSTVTLHLTIHDFVATNDYVTICDSELPYTYGDTVFSVGTPAFSTTVFNLQTVNGCDSIATLHLTIHPTFAADTTVDICDVDLPFFWNGQEYWETDVYEIHYPTLYNCDSLVRLHLNVHPTYNRDTLVTVCNGVLPYEFCTGYIFSEGGNHTVTLQTVNGCDSVWNLELNVIPNTEHTASQTVCDNELPVLFMGESFDHAGTFDIAETDLDGCVTITHFTLTVNETYHGYDALTVCQEELPVFYGDSVLTTAGTHDVHFSAANLCDSLVTVTLNIIPTAQGTEVQHVCTNDFPFSYGRQTFNTEGVYTVTFDREGLCDSVVTLTLIEAQEYSFTETAEVCDHTLPYFWRGGEYNQSGVYYDSLTSFFGCDSVFVLNLTVNETQVVVSDPIVLCDGESETWHGMTLSEAGIYRDTLLNDITGCRVIHEVMVIVNPTYLFHDTATVCSDELPYVWRGLTINEAGVREDYLQTVNTFCDSIYRLTLIVNPSYHATESASVCDYDLPYLWHGQAIMTAGSYFDTLHTVNGCDSTFALTLTINASQFVQSADTICDSELPYSWRNQSITAAGTYRDTVTNAFGCQDIFELALTVNSSDVITLHDTICEGGYYSNYGFDTLAAQAGTLYLHQYLNNSLGCDSTVNLVLTVSPVFFSEEFSETCQNTPYEWRGFVFDTEGTYYDSLVASTGCDSVYVLHLTVNPTYDIFVYDTAMRENYYSFDENFSITPADSGTFQYDFQHYTLAGCDSIVHLILYVQYNDGIEEHVMLPDFKFFPNPTTAVLNITGDHMRQVLVYDLNGKLVHRVDADAPESTRIDVTGFATGHYVVKVLLDDGQSVTRKIVVNRW